MPRTLPVLLVLVLVSTVGADPLKKPKRGFQMLPAPYTVGPGQDLEWCEYRRLPNTKPVDVTGFDLSMDEGAHHFVIWSYGGPTEDDSKFPAGPVESVGCTGVSPDEIAPQVLIPIQTPNTRFDFPKGLALRLEPHQQVWLNPHIKNLGDTPITPDIRFNFRTAKRGTVKHRIEGMIVGNVTDIDVPAGGRQTITVEWTAPVNLTIAHLSTHQHQLGTYANIELVDREGTPRKIYENVSWQHPRLSWPRPRIRLLKGDKMRITCTWENPTDERVRFGPETTDEMCFILGFYYRDKRDDAPVNGGGCIPARRGLLCPLAPVVASSN
jgi:hypothetical protein